MKRLFPAILAVVLLLFGCGKEIAETVPIASIESQSCINVCILPQARDFGAFTAQPPGPEAETARTMVREVLDQYPAGFADQWGPVEILLVGQLTGTDRFSGGCYAGFTQQTGDGWLLVLDAGRADIGTVHHEIAHILDGILTEAGALTGPEWLDLCPPGFCYGAGRWEDYPDFFADAYAMESIREDRARTFEDAILCGEGAYLDRPALWLKLERFSRAIRDHFDTAGWPERTIWELALG